MSDVAAIPNPDISTMYFDNNPIRYFMHNEVLYVCGIDVTKAFGYKDEYGPLRTVEDEDRVVLQVQNSRVQLRPTIFINEPAFYELAFRSNLEAARRFTRKVSGEILPAIRRTGRYEGESLNAIVGNTARPWERMYDEDFRALIPSTGMSAPQFYEFLYTRLHPEGTLDSMRSRIVKKFSGGRKDNYDIDTGLRVRLHQYFTDLGRSSNKFKQEQLALIIQYMLSGNCNKKEFLVVCNKVFKLRDPLAITAK